MEQKQQKAHRDIIRAGAYCKPCQKALEFDHLDTNAKNANISSMVAESCFSIEDIDYEISICRLVCRKCHRIHSLTQRMEHWADIRAENN